MFTTLIHLGFFSSEVVFTVFYYLSFYCMNIAIILVAITTMTFWAYSNLWYERRILPYAQWYTMFGLIQWVLIFINLVWIWGWIVGIFGIAGLMFGGVVIVTNFTTNYLYKLIKISPTIGLLIFVILVWILAILSVIKIFI